jgi:N-acetylneuraminic acid mutarotase
VRRRDLLAGAAATIATGCLGVRRDSQAPIDMLKPGRWTVHRPMPEARQEVAVATLGDRVVVVGGFGELGAAVATVEAYRPDSDTWEAMPPLPAGVHHATAAVVDGRLFVIGGYADRVPPWRAQRTVYEYDGAARSWATRAPLNVARGAPAAAVIAGRIHVVGGADGSAMDVHEAYDPAADRWTRLAPMPTARDHLAAAAFRGRLWAIGGRASFMGAQYANVEIYDAAADRWDAGVPLPEGRGGLAAAAFDDRVYVFGGESPVKIFSAVEMYEVAGNRWIGKEPMPTPRHGIGAAVLDGAIWIPGGATRPGFGRTSANEAYRP